MDWLTAHAADAAQYLARKPSRSKRPRAAPPAIAPLVRYGALWLAQLGKLAALHFDDPRLQRDAGSPREVRAARAHLVVALSLLVVRPEPWLWDEPPDLTDPFDPAAPDET
ncbi:hypothetical protein [uncultured Lamprocystis sp.]|jgi:hypothetical protein|uniref:hypothetical protein n=1 Tax=uncultured Lamprocystis sp. TaxID=543132 RepID=UPI0025F88556|nr:hypothetical protein [uncultured Lamprocystis sp.]